MGGCGLGAAPKRAKKPSYPDGLELGSSETRTVELPTPIEVFFHEDYCLYKMTITGYKTLFTPESDAKLRTMLEAKHVYLAGDDTGFIPDRFFKAFSQAKRLAEKDDSDSDDSDSDDSDDDPLVLLAELTNIRNICTIDS